MFAGVVSDKNATHVRCGKLVYQWACHNRACTDADIDMEIVEIDALQSLITEAIRGEGAVLKDRRGRAFMGKSHALKDLAPRDTVARAIDLELKKSGED